MSDRPPQPPERAAASPFKLAIEGNGFVLDGRPFRLIGGAMHYDRVPRAYWRDRMKKLLALGCNTLETYVFWNVHEPRPGEYDFEGDRDLVAFVELAGEMGLHVIVRPGPYVCAERDFGGLPWWLNAEDDLTLRTSDPKYLAHVERWWNELIPRLAPLQSTRGGPIVAMQVENEYGYYGDDTKYLETLRDLLRGHGVDVLLFTSDGTYERKTIQNGGIDGLLRTANFGSGAAERFKVLREFQPTGPLVCTEFWVGWFDTWGDARHNGRSAEECAKELDELLAQDASLVFYMFHGGTNFGFSAGGNLSEHFKPFVTSYDYDALLTEAGDVTDKYRACRKVLRKRFDLGEMPVVQNTTKRAYGDVELTNSIPLDAALPQLARPIHSPAPRPMEKLGIGSGYVLYRHTLSAIDRGQPLVIRGMHDWCHLLLDGRSLATWYRNDDPPEVTLEFDGDSATLDVLVHHLARSNFGHRMTERKGITGGIFTGPTRHDERALFGWEQYPLPMDNLGQLDWPGTGGFNGDGPAFHRATLNVDEPADTFLKVGGGTFGFVCINGFNLGRYWNIGPQQTLYVPAPRLKSGENEIVIFDAVGLSAPTMTLADAPELGPRA